MVNFLSSTISSLWLFILSLGGSLLVDNSNPKVRVFLNKTVHEAEWSVEFSQQVAVRAVRFGSNYNRRPTKLSTESPTRLRVVIFSSYIDHLLVWPMTESNLKPPFLKAIVGSSGPKTHDHFIKACHHSTIVASIVY